VEGAVTRFENLYREDPGPRAIMNAVARLVDGYVVERRNTAKELEIARGQLRDYQSRTDKPFQHDEYLGSLQDLRNQLETALSDKPAEGVTQEEVVVTLACSSTYRHFKADFPAPPPGSSVGSSTAPPLEQLP
jgi:hypothetical protein